jgi:hypothetical protein
MQDEKADYIRNRAEFARIVKDWSGSEEVLRGLTENNPCKSV